MREFPNTIHNQTNPESIARWRSSDAKEAAFLGTAVYILPDPVSGPACVQSMLTENVPYDECEARAAYCIAFKWISNEVASYADVVKHKAERNCTQDFCPSPNCGPQGSICACVGGNCYI